MTELVAIHSPQDIPVKYRNTPIELLFHYHNFNKPFELYNKAELLVGMCMDNRKHLNIPDNFAFIIRSGGANLRYSEFKVSFAISVGQVNHIVLIGHNLCGMVNLNSKKAEFIEGLVERAGWDYQTAEEHFMQFVPSFEIGNEMEFILSETHRLRSRYPKVMIAPLFYTIEDNRLYLINE